MEYSELLVQQLSNKPNGCVDDSHSIPVSHTKRVLLRPEAVAR